MLFAKKCAKSFVFSCVNKIFSLSLLLETKHIGFVEGKQRINTETVWYILITPPM